MHKQDSWRQVTPSLVFNLRNHLIEVRHRAATSRDHQMALQLNSVPFLRGKPSLLRVSHFRWHGFTTSLPSVISIGFSKRKCFEMQPPYWLKKKSHLEVNTKNTDYAKDTKVHGNKVWCICSRTSSPIVKAQKWTIGDPHWTLTKPFFCLLFLLLKSC